MGKLEKSPLVYVVAQVRIGAVLKMADYAGAIAKALKTNGVAPDVIAKATGLSVKEISER